MKKFDLEERLTKFSISILNLAEKLPKTYTGIHLSKQIIRSGTSPTLNYAEAIAGESVRDFIHKIKIGLKELRETHICLRIIKNKPLINDKIQLSNIEDECSQLIKIFVSSIKTATKNHLVAKKI